MWHKRFNKTGGWDHNKKYSLQYQLFVENYFQIIYICLEDNKSNNEEILSWGFHF